MKGHYSASSFRRLVPPPWFGSGRHCLSGASRSNARSRNGPMRGIDMKCNVRSVRRRPRGPHAGSVGAGTRRNHTPHFITGGWMTGQSWSPPPSPVTLDSPQGAARLGELRWLGLNPSWAGTGRDVKKGHERLAACGGGPGRAASLPDGARRAGRGRVPRRHPRTRPERAGPASGLVVFSAGRRTGEPGPSSCGHGPALAGLCPEHRARPPVLAPALVLRPSPAPLLRSAGPRDPLAPRSFRVAGPILTWRRLGAGALAEIIECRATRPCPGGRLGVAWRSPRRPKNARRRRAVHP